MVSPQGMHRYLLNPNEYSHIAGKHVVLHASPEGVTISEVAPGTQAPHADKSAEEQEKVASSQRPVMPGTTRMVSSLILAFAIWCSSCIAGLTL